jgi:hypothetical protein
LHDGSLEDKRKEQRKFHIEAHIEKKRWVALLTPKFRKKKREQGQIMMIYLILKFGLVQDKLQIFIGTSIKIEFVI